jgi:hypothetical protein
MLPSIESDYELITEHLRDLLLEDRTALSEQEILQLKIIFNKSQKLIDCCDNIITVTLLGYLTE